MSLDFEEIERWYHFTSPQNHDDILDEGEIDPHSSKSTTYEEVLAENGHMKGVWFLGNSKNDPDRTVYPTWGEADTSYGISYKVEDLLESGEKWSVYRVGTNEQTLYTQVNYCVAEWGTVANKELRRCAREGSYGVVEVRPFVETDDYMKWGRHADGDIWVECVPMNSRTKVCVNVKVLTTAPIPISYADDDYLEADRIALRNTKRRRIR